MKRQLGAVLVGLVLFCAPAIWAQSDSSDSSSSSSGSSDSSSSSGTGTNTSGGSVPSIGASTSGGSYAGSYTDPIYQVGSGDSQSGSTDSSSDSSQTTTAPQSTFSHPEQLPPLSTINDVYKDTGIAMSFNAGSLTDYVWGGHNQKYWQNMALWAGGINFSQLRSTSIVQLGYIGGINMTSLTIPGANTYTQLSQQANARILWNFANHWQLKIKDNYIYTDDPFSPFLTYVSEPTPNQPNPTIYVPNAVIEQNMGTIDLSYRIAAHDSLTFTGAESLTRYIRGASGLWNSYTYSGGGFYQHMFSPNLAAGLGYDYSALDFGHGQSRAGVQMFETFVMYRFTPGLSVSGWVGPELTHTKDLVPIFCSPYGCLIEEMHNKQWDVAEGGTISYFKNGNSIRANFSHRVTDGGGILGATNLWQATIAYARPLSRLWGFSSALMYSNSISISHIRADQYWDAAQGMLNFTRKIGESWNGSVFLLFIDQKQNFYGTPGTSATAGVGLTLRYVWGHSLGR